MNNGADDNPNNHLHPRFGATANARATSKHAPSAQKHYTIFRSILFIIFLFFFFIFFSHHTHI